MSSPARKQVLRSSENVVAPIDQHAYYLQQVTKKVAPPVASSATSSAGVAARRGGTISTVPSPSKDEPPKPPRSAFICFTDAKKKEIMNQRGIVQENDDILKIVAREWKLLSDKDRAKWDEEARNDKVRFVQEKAAYKGSWAIPKRRAKKHPLAPKRPMSAFLKYSQTRRAKVKEDNPDMSNTDVSRLLGEMWRNASPKERAPYVEQEERERTVYKEEIKKFRDDQARMDAASRSSHQSVQSYRHQHPQAQPQQPSQPQQPPHHHQQPHHQVLSHQPERPPYSNGAAASFENLHIDTFDEPVQKKPYRQQHYSSNPYPLYRHTQYHLQPELTSQHSADFQEADPIPVSRLPLVPTHPMDREDDLYDNHYVSNSRSSYFSENINSDYYSRYH